MVKYIVILVTYLFGQRVTVDITKREMVAATAECRTKADKIRALAGLGVPTADIARFLGIRYQHAYNVLKQSRPTRAGPPGSGSRKPAQGPCKARLDSSNRIEIPERLLDALGITAGDELLLRADGDEIRLTTRGAGLHQAREILGRYVKAGTNLADELIVDRRREAEDDRE